MKIGGIEVSGITNDSRRVQPGWAFFAVRGAKMDATQFIPDVLARGASVVVTDKDYKGDSFKVDNVSKFLGETAAKFFAPLPENIIAVTGTAGKTSTVHFCRVILENLGKNAASIGTMGLIHKGINAEIGTSTNTTPDAILLAQTLHNLKLQGCDYVAMEASSIGIAQDRMTALPVKVAAFTNLSRDHISETEHKDMDDYFAAKKRLFTEVLAQDGIAVLNADEPKSVELANIKQKILWYGKTGTDIKLVDAEYTEESQKVTIEIGGKNYSYELEAAGEFQTYNSMCAIGMVIGLGFPVKEIIDAINESPAPAGRLQFIGTPVEGGGVYADFAHTPGALQAVLESARKFCKGRLMVLSGTGAPRDPGKRPMMGAVMQALADVVYITDGSFRIYDPKEIRDNIASKCPKGIIIPGRRNAIAQAVRDMKENDVLVVCGMGEEQWLYMGTGRYHFSDIEEAKKAIDFRKCFPGIDLPL